MVHRSQKYHLLPLHNCDTHITWLMDKLTDCFTDFFTDWLTERMNEWKGTHSNCVFVVLLTIYAFTNNNNNNTTAGQEWGGGGGDGTAAADDDDNDDHDDNDEFKQGMYLCGPRLSENTNILAYLLQSGRGCWHGSFDLSDQRRWSSAIHVYWCSERMTRTSWWCFALTIGFNHSETDVRVHLHDR